MQSIKQLFRALTPEELALRELTMARKAKLEAESARDYAAAIVKYNEARILRLSNYVYASAPTTNKDQA